MRPQMLLRALVHPKQQPTEKEIVLGLRGKQALLDGHWKLWLNVGLVLGGWVVALPTSSARSASSCSTTSAGGCTGVKELSTFGQNLVRNHGATEIHHDSAEDGPMSCATVACPLRWGDLHDGSWLGCV